MRGYSSRRDGTAASDRTVDERYVKMHLQIGIDSLKQLINRGLTVKHLKF
jgi:AMP nucleosidase